MERLEVARIIALENEKLERSALPQSVGELFDNAVAANGDRVLWHSVDSGEAFTYNQFADAVDRCMTVLMEAGVKAGSHVGLMLPNVAALGVTWMALARIGAVMLPVNTNYIAREVASLVDKGDVSLLVVDDSFLEVVDTGEVKRPGLTIIVHGKDERFGATWHQRVDQAVPFRGERRKIVASDLMSIQFTSGSTGLPKGCMLSHQYWTILGYVRSWHGPRCERMLIDMPFHYMGGQWRFLMALVMGSTAYVALKPTIKDMVSRLVEYGIDFCSVSPLMAKHPEDPQRDKLKLKWAGTMVLPPVLHPVLEDRLNGAAVREMYGLTETGAVLAMPYIAECMIGSGMIGLPTPYRKVRIVDAQGNDVPPGTEGELWVSGPGLMSGYYKRPEANEEAWRGEWFRTGDLFVQDENGYYKIVGRIKDVIRRSGENVAATEVEYVASAIPNVEDVAAVPVPDAKRGEEVKLILVVSPGHSPETVTPESVRDFCAKGLAAFKVPRYISYLPSLPKTPSGKTAKTELVKADYPVAAQTYDLLDGKWL